MDQGPPVTVPLPDPPRGADDSKRMLDELVSRALAYRTSGEFKALLEFCRRFPHLAPYNAMLLHVQNASLQYALRAPVWERKYGRRVKRGARPYVILQTMGPVAFVFDVHDTEPDGSLAQPLPEAVTNPFPARGQPPAGALSNLKKSCASIGFSVGECEYAATKAGQVECVSGGGYDYHVSLNTKHTEAQKLGTLAHELAHVFCGHLGASAKGWWWPDRMGLDLLVREFEAEAVAYFVTERMALDIGSVQYLSGYLKIDRALPNYSLETVLKAAGKVEEMASGRFRPKPKKEKE